MPALTAGDVDAAGRPYAGVGNVANRPYGGGAERFLDSVTHGDRVRASRNLGAALP
jgi:hypothetical protein